jgi:hypothetical protein
VRDAIERELASIMRRRGLDPFRAGDRHVEQVAVEPFALDRIDAGAVGTGVAVSVGSALAKSFGDRTVRPR